VTIKLRNKTPRGWIGQEPLKHQTQTLLCHFLAVCLLFVSLGRVMWVPYSKMTFAYYLAQNLFDLLSMGAVQICASSALNGNLISE